MTKPYDVKTNQGSGSVRTASMAEASGDTGLEHHPKVGTLATVLRLMILGRDSIVLDPGNVLKTPGQDLVHLRSMHVGPSSSS